MFETGTARIELDAYHEGIGMLGYGRDWNKLHGKITPLFIRSFCFREPVSGNRFFFVNCELCFTTSNVKEEVIRRLCSEDPAGDYRDENIMITSQHTHSAPGGFAHHPLYNFPVPGFRLSIFNKVVDAIKDAILESAVNLQPSEIRFGSGEFGPSEDVGFNRSLKAYNQNPEVTKRSVFETHLAMERTMDLLRIDDANGTPIGQINFFGVHTTSLGNRVNKQCSDNKGFAATYFEEARKGNFTAIFAQQLAADISPNFHGKGKNWKKGPTSDDVENARFNGQLQFKKAESIWNDALKSAPVKGDIDYEIMYADFSDIKVHPDFANGRTDAETGSACHGVSFFSGTPVDGPGMGAGVREFAIFCSLVVKGSECLLAKFRKPEYRDWVHKKYKVQSPKHIIFETGRGVVYGTRRIKHFFIPGFLDGGIKEMKNEHRLGALRELPWTPHVLPLHIVTMGPLAFIGFPGEISTAGGQRLRNMLKQELAAKGVEQVIICSYANNYMGYCVTNEEYQVQCYEGGHTVFGQWTHAAFMTKFRELAREIVKPDLRQIDRSVLPHRFSEKEMALRSYD